MDLEPPKAIFTDSLALGELQNTSVQILSHVIQMGRNWVDTATEIAIVREV